MSAALETRHPDPVTQQQMVERAVHTAEEGAKVALVLRARQRAAGGVERFVGEPVVARVLRPGLSHAATLAGGDGDPVGDVANDARGYGAAQAAGADRVGGDFGEGRKGN